MSEEMSNEEVRQVVNEMNAHALADNISAMREEYEIRLTALENEVSSLKILVQKQSVFIGTAMQGLMGSGSTVKE